MIQFRYNPITAHGLGLLLAIFCGFSISSAQEGPVTGGDAHIHQTPIYQTPLFLGRGISPDTITITASQPFFDDFSSGGSLPDSAWWWLDLPASILSDPPTVTRNFAINPPSRGVATFDGTDLSGLPYDLINFSVGIRDRLISHYIDLSAYGLSDSIKLSFALQPQGRGDAPEGLDSFFVYFVTPNDTVLVYGQGGSKVRAFKSVILPLDSSAYYDPLFQMVFQSRGSLNGYLDTWHLDYVYLGLNRSSGDTLFDDRSPTLLRRSIFEPFTSMPVEYYEAFPKFMQPFSVVTSNLSGTANTVDQVVEITEPKGGNPLTGLTRQVKSLSLAPNSHKILGYSAFDDQNLSGLSAVRLQIHLDQVPDLFPGNDTLVEYFSLDSVFGMDDGEADKPFGLNVDRGFGVEYDLGRVDSLNGCLISFVPLMNVRNGKPDYMDGKPFRLVIWDQPHPDSIQVSLVSGMNIHYGDTLNHFEYYPFTKPVVVSGTFWIGIQQFDNNSVGIGFDETYDNSAITYWDSSGFWVTTRVPGTIMLRPVLHNGFPPIVDIEDDLISETFRIFPNPLSGSQLQIVMGDAWINRRVKLSLWGINGVRMTSPSLELDHRGRILMDIPSTLPNGLYLIRVEDENPTGNTTPRAQKLLIQRPN